MASVGELGGIVPYTSYSAKNSYILNNKNTIESFTHAIQRGLDFVHSHSDLEVAKAIINQFPDTSLSDLEKVSFDHLQNIMLDYGAIDSKVSYGKLIYNEN